MVALLLVLSISSAEAFTTKKKDCKLEVTESCFVPNSDNFVCSKAKPIDSITMFWDGQTTINVRAWKGPVGSTLLKEISEVGPGDEVTVQGYKGGPEDVIWEIFDAATGEKIGESSFNLACRDKEMIGASNCGTRQGNGKANSASYMNDWIFGGMSGTQELLCGLSPFGIDTTCNLPGIPAPPDCKGSVQELKFLYVGGSCSQTDNSQGADGLCTDSSPASGPVRIVVMDRDRKLTWLDTKTATINPGDMLTVSASTLKKKVFTNGLNISIYDAQGMLTQSVSLASNCSKALDLNDRFGALEVVGITTTGGGALSAFSKVNYLIRVTNLGVSTTDVSMEGDVFSGAMDPPFDLAPGQSRTFKKTDFMMNGVTDTVVANGQGAYGSCRAQATSTGTYTDQSADSDCSTAIKSNFNGTRITAGDHIWFNSVAHIGPAEQGTTLYFSNQQIKFYIDEVEINVPLPASQVTFTDVTEAITEYDPLTGWITRVPAGYSGNVFLGGGLWEALSFLSDGSDSVTWSGDMSSNVSGLSVSWKWAAAVYSGIGTVPPEMLGVKPIDGSHHAGTPESIKEFVIGGARGGGGSNFTGSYSATKSATPCRIEIPR